VANILTLTDWQVKLLNRLANSDSSQIALIEPLTTDAEEDIKRKYDQMGQVLELKDEGLLKDVSETFSEGIAKCRADNKGRGYSVFEVTEPAIWLFCEYANRTVQ
jgi:hypothetical protein